MCYYDQTLFGCGDWKWGNFRKHCNKEYRMGETCGLKLVNNTHREPGMKCATCISLDKKNRRYAKAKSDYDRWIVDSTRQASAAKAAEECQVLYREIEDLQAQRISKFNNINGNRGSRQRQN